MNVQILGEKHDLKFRGKFPKYKRDATWNSCVCICVYLKLYWNCMWTAKKIKIETE